MTRSVAGHSLTDGPKGTYCKWCGMTWLYLLDRRDEWVQGRMGIAHSGGLTATECRELQAEADRAWKALQA